MKFVSESTSENIVCTPILSTILNRSYGNTTAARQQCISEGRADFKRDLARIDHSRGSFVLCWHSPADFFYRALTRQFAGGFMIPGTLLGGDRWHGRGLFYWRGSSVILFSENSFKIEIIMAKATTAPTQRWLRQAQVATVSGILAKIDIANIAPGSRRPCRLVRAR